MKLKSLLLEKQELPQNVVDKIAKLTDYNNHNEARLVLAKQMGLKNLVKGYEAIMILPALIPFKHVRFGTPKH